MLTKEENELLCRVGPGTPAGELLRRYWHPVALAQDLTDESPTRFVRLLGEDLVVFKDKSGRIGMLADHCSHRGASLLYGRVEERGIACAYHGWLYDTAGNCLETPAEPEGSLFHLTVKHTAYPVKKFVGLLWAYMGPLPAPEIPPFDVWMRTDGKRSIVVQPMLDCNWVTPMENSVDSTHSHFLHRPLVNVGPVTGDPEQFGYREYEFGIMKKRLSYGRKEEHPLIFPTILRQGDHTEIRVPVDDTHTQLFRVHFTPSPDGAQGDPDDVRVRYDPDYKTPLNAVHPDTRFHMDNRIVATQDYMAWETQGPIADRTNERLATADRGIVMFREMLKREIEKVQQGLDPICIIRDPNYPLIDTNLDETMREIRGGRDREMEQVAVGLASDDDLRAQ